MQKLNRTDAIIKAIERAKESEFGVTAIKVELEAHLHRDDTNDWDRSHACHDDMMRRLSELGLAEQGDWHILGHSGVETDWHPVAPLTYAEFYNDGSVDSEFTFTILLDDPKNALLLPKVVEAWNEFCVDVTDDSGWDIDVDGAGMHMAFLNDPRGRYPSRPTGAQLSRFDNFRRSMTLLLPAMYFLASSDSHSRSLEYRRPSISYYGGDDDWNERRSFKYSAITYSQGAIEFRVFNTCYQNPDAILDNLVVMSNAVSRYWTAQYVPSGLEKITRQVQFGNNYDDSLSRFYISVEHVDLLNEGLKILKPSYYSITELKQQRQFKVTKRSITGAISRIKREAVQQYKDYEFRFNWGLEAMRYSQISMFLDRRANNPQYDSQSDTEVLEAAKATAEEYVQRQTANKKSLETFINEKVAQYLSSQRAAYSLEVA